MIFRTKQQDRPHNQAQNNNHHGESSSSSKPPPPSQETPPLDPAQLRALRLARFETNIIKSQDEPKSTPKSDTPISQSSSNTPKVSNTPPIKSELRTSSNQITPNHDTPEVDTGARNRLAKLRLISRLLNVKFKGIDLSISHLSSSKSFSFTRQSPIQPIEVEVEIPASIGEDQSVEIGTFVDSILFNVSENDRFLNHPLKYLEYLLDILMYMKPAKGGREVQSSPHSNVIQSTMVQLFLLIGQFPEQVWPSLWISWFGTVKFGDLDFLTKPYFPFKTFPNPKHILDLYSNDDLDWLSMEWIMSSLWKMIEDEMEKSDKSKLDSFLSESQLSVVVSFLVQWIGEDLSIDNMRSLGPHYALTKLIENKFTRSALFNHPNWKPQINTPNGKLNGNYYGYVKSTILGCLLCVSQVNFPIKGLPNFGLRMSSSDASNTTNMLNSQRYFGHTVRELHNRVFKTMLGDKQARTELLKWIFHIVNCNSANPHTTQYRINWETDTSLQKMDGFFFNLTFAVLMALKPLVNQSNSKNHSQLIDEVDFNMLQQNSFGLTFWDPATLIKLDETPQQKQQPQSNESPSLPSPTSELSSTELQSNNGVDSNTSRDLRPSQQVHKKSGFFCELFFTGIYLLFYILNPILERAKSTSQQLMKYSKALPRLEQEANAQQIEHIRSVIQNLASRLFSTHVAWTSHDYMELLLSICDFNFQVLNHHLSKALSKSGSNFDNFIPKDLSRLLLQTTELNTGMGEDLSNLQLFKIPSHFVLSVNQLLNSVVPIAKDGLPLVTLGTTIFVPPSTIKALTLLIGIGIGKIPNYHVLNSSVSVLSSIYRPKMPTSSLSGTSQSLISLELTPSPPEEFSNMLKPLIGYYIDVEHTGSRAQFYEKFPVRHELSGLLKCSLSYNRSKMDFIRICQDSKLVIPFLTVLVNDNLYLLDESMNKIKKIKDAKSRIENLNVDGNNNNAINNNNTAQSQSRQELVNEMEQAQNDLRSLTTVMTEPFMLFETISSLSLQAIVMELNAKATSSNSNPIKKRRNSMPSSSAPSPSHSIQTIDSSSSQQGSDIPPIIDDQTLDPLVTLLNYFMNRFCNQAKRQEFSLADNTDILDSNRQDQDIGVAFDPKRIIASLAMTFLNLNKLCHLLSKLKQQDSTPLLEFKFIDKVVTETRSFSIDTFLQCSNLLKTKQISFHPGSITSLQFVAGSPMPDPLDPLDIPSFIQQSFTEFCNLMKERIQITKDAEIPIDEIPEEFLDGITFTLMKDPVKLPSGNIVDRSTILRHLQGHDPRDPFTRKPLQQSDIVTDDELKEKIIKWIDSRNM